ncbi:hypothetical protein ACHHYP_14448 [Achlya hypogyna]|uniref:LNR domain-containing protein n=1 Tax=Achlya hypogyna TaxID=1202772 RepID=A0A1V9ZFM7_ACHHY|nr:hypothetical protein ACHHYP_14448 [Achlya hypogyna]
MRRRPDLAKVALFFGTSDADWTSAERRFLLFVAYVQGFLGFLNFLIAGTILWSFTEGQAKVVGASSPRATAVLFWLLALLYLSAMRPPVRAARVYATRSPTVAALPSFRRFARFRPSANIEIGLSHTVVIVCQTYLASLMASTLTQVAVATVYGAMVVLNATVTPLFLFTKSTRSKRLLLDLVDSFLSFTLSVGLSLVVFLLPLLRVQMATSWSTNHPSEWYAANYAAIHLFLVMPPAQLASTVVPNVVMVVALRHTIATLRTMPTKIPTPLTTVHPSSVFSAPAVRRGSKLGTLVTSATGEWRKRFTLAQANMRFLVGIFAFNVAWGLGVLALLLYAQQNGRGCPAHCLASSMPWWSRGCSCIYARLQCTATTVDCDVDEFMRAEVLGTNLLLLHTVGCARPPTRLHEFPSLFRVDIEFSAMTAWDIAALPPSLRMLIVRYTNLTVLPAVLAAPGDTLHVLHVVSSPLRDVPPDVWRNWTQLTALWLSDTRLTTVPDTVQGLAILEDLVLSANFISALPDGLQHLPALRRLALDANPISTFPQALVLAKPFLQLALDHTAIAALPDAAAVQAAVVAGYVQLHSTPFCASHTPASLALACSPACSATCSVVHWGDSYCDLSCHSPACRFDGGDCSFL